MRAPHGPAEEPLPRGTTRAPIAPPPMNRDRWHERRRSTCVGRAGEVFDEPAVGVGAGVGAGEFEGVAGLGDSGMVEDEGVGGGGFGGGVFQVGVADDVGARGEGVEGREFAGLLAACGSEVGASREVYGLAVLTAGMFLERERAAGRMEPG